MRKRKVLLLLGCLAAAFVPLTERVDGLRVGSKKFTESVILGELVALTAQEAGVDMLHARELGGTRIVYEALLAGEIDVYPEYTGTLTQEIFAGERIDDLGALRERLLKDGIIMSARLGFNNGYALGMLAERAHALGIETVSDLAGHTDLVLGFGNEFMDRQDGCPALQRIYGLPQQSVSGMEHDLAYRQLSLGVIDVMEVYTTDAGIRYHNIKLLRDDREHFSLYEAVLLYRADLDKREPRLVRGMLALTEKISAVDMLAMNSAAQLERIPEREVAARFLAEALSLEVAPKVETRLLRLKKYTLEHLAMVRLSFLLAILCGLPLGILAAKKRRLGQVVLALVGMIQTIPALALLVILIQPAAFLGLGGVGSGSAAAIAALFLYSLLPIVRNTCEGLRDISPDLSEAALALGLPPAARLFEVELPLASRTILAGLKTAAILNIGFATLGALIGAGGYGQPILTGIRLDDSALILEGALPSALLALLAQGLFEILDRVLIPAGLRLPPAD